MFPTSVCYFSQLLAAKHAFLRSCRIWIRTGTKCFRVLVWVTRRTPEGSHRSLQSTRRSQSGESVFDRVGTRVVLI